MTWTVEYATKAVRGEMRKLPKSIQAKFDRLYELIEE